MLNNITLVTTKRDHLVSIVNMLIESLPPEHMHKRKKPFTFSIRGNYKSGKKLFPEEALEKLINKFNAQSVGQKGNHDWDEFYRLQTNSNISKVPQSIEHSFINMAVINRYGTMSLKNPLTWFARTRRKMFFSLRKYGGVAFVHNDDDFAKKSSVDIWLERPAFEGHNQDEEGMVGKCASEINKLNADVKTAFNQVETEKDWKRLVKIKIRDERVLNNPNFMNLWKGFAESFKGSDFALDQNEEGIYAVPEPV